MNSLHRTLLCLSLVTGASTGCSGSDKAEKKVTEPVKDADSGPVTPGEDAGGGGNGNGDAGEVVKIPEIPLAPTEPTKLTDGCDGQKLREGIPEDLSKDGPWPVGSLTTELAGLPTEVWYPAEQGSGNGKNRIVYDMREHLPPDDAAKIPDAHVPTHNGNCAEGLPFDKEAGPYPVLLFVHGTAGFRTTNVDNMTHWASRGFVVVAADHPGIRLKDLLASIGAGMLGNLGGGGGVASGQAPEARAMLEELAKTQGDLAFLKGHIDMEKVGLVGHSAGGGAVSGLGDIADVIVIYAAGGSIVDAPRAKSMMSLMGATDGVAGADPAGYTASNTATKRFVSLGKGGHLVGGNLCTMRDPADPMKDIVDLAEEYKLGGVLAAVPGALRAVFGMLFDGCNELADDDEPFIAASRGIELMNYATSGAFEEVLHCSNTAKRLTDMPKTYGKDVADYQETLP